MEKSVTLNLRVNPTVKQQAEDVLKQLGIPMSTAVDMFLRQVSLTRGIPFPVSLPTISAAVDSNAMADEQLRAASGPEEAGSTENAAADFAESSNGAEESHRQTQSAARLALNINSLRLRGWQLDIFNCVDSIPANEFELKDMYRFESELFEKHPGNNTVQAQIRRQLQLLRDKGIIEFLDRGKYRKLYS